MIIQGEKVTADDEVVLVLPRQKKDIIFKARHVSSYDDFDKICPEPIPRKKRDKAGVIINDVKNKKYKKDAMVWGDRRVSWLVLTSLQATEGLEWETVEMDKPETWENYRKELNDSGISQMEQNMIFDAVLTACGFNEAKIKQATEDFLAGAPKEQVDQ